MGNCLDSSSTVQPSNNDPPKKTNLLLFAEPKHSYLEENKSIISNGENTPRSQIRRKGFEIRRKQQTIVTFDAPTAVITDKPKTPKDIKLILDSLSKHFVFNGLRRDFSYSVIQEMKHFQLGQSETIFDQNQPGHNFFVIASGEVELLINGNLINTLGAGDSFGDIALLHDSLRTASARTSKPTCMWGIDRKTFRKSLEALNKSYYIENKSFLQSIPIFHILTQKQKDALAAAFSRFEYAEGDHIVNEGDPGELLYIIKEGSVTCYVKEQAVRRLEKGEYFGEQALLYSSPRTATVVANSAVKCIAIGTKKLNKVLGNNLRQVIYSNSLKIAFDQSEFLQKLSPENMKSLISAMEIKSYNQGDVIVAANTSKNSLLIVILKGKVSTNSLIIEKFGCLGDEAIANENTSCYEENIVADEDTDIAVISGTRFCECIGGKFVKATSNNKVLAVIKKIQLFRELGRDKLNEILEKLTIEEFHDDQIIVEQGTIGDSFFIIKSGTVEVWIDHQMVRSITKLDYFGERSLLFNEPRTATVKAKSIVSCWALKKSDFSSVIDEGVRSILLKRIQLQDNNVELTDLLPVKLIGKGMYGNVFLTVHKTTNALYALKTVSREKVNKYHLQDNILLERNILMTVDHTFILKLIRTFKDQHRLYFLLEYVKGLDLFDVLREMGLVSDHDAKFFTASLIIILEHLHEREIIYRDLKPENIMVDDEGYLKLIDFGTAKIVSGRTFTVVGTPHYMAPEIITGKGYEITADYWSLGIIIFEFLCGNVPFGENEEDPYLIYECILARKIVYPPWIQKNLPAKPLIEQLLSKNPSSRIKGSIENLKNNCWLENMEWDKLLMRQLKAPYKARLPNLNKEVQFALKSIMDLQETIRRQEGESIPMNGKKRISLKSSLDHWDSEF